MAHAYTPGLQVLDRVLLTKDRTLPLRGEVLVKPDDKVKADQVVARAELPNEVLSVNVVNLLGIVPKEIREYMIKREEDPVKEGEPIAENRPLIKWFKTTVPAPCDGTIETVSDVTGQVMVRKPPRHVELLAHVDGTVTSVDEGIGVEIETACAYVQGIFGIGGERVGELVMGVSSPAEELKPESINESHAGKIIVGGSFISAKTLKKAIEVGANGIIGGGVNSQDLTEWLGYEMGVAITGDEQVTTTFIITEGFGHIPMVERTFNLLKAREGQQASISGRTQIRAGVMRPEIIIPFDPSGERVPRQEDIEQGVSTGVQAGHQVRIIREPYFGQVGKVKSLPSELQQIETEAKVRVMEIQLSSGETVMIPRANVEVIETD